MISLLREALGALRARRGRATLAGIGIALAAAMLGTATVVGYGLQTGFARSARAADLPDVIARFDQQPLNRIAQRIRALPNLAAYTFRLELTNVPIAADGHSSRQGVVEVLNPGRRGFAIIDGRMLSARPGEVVLEQGVAHAWGLHPGSTLDVSGLGPQLVVGVAESPDNVAFPLAAPRIYLSRAALDTRFGAERAPQVNVVELWTQNPGDLEETLVQARATSFGIRGLRFVTRDGVRVLLDQAAGIVIALLGALSAIALITAAVMLGASAHAEVQRRLADIGMRRALGASRARVSLAQSMEALIVAVPAGTLGVLAGTVAASSPSDRLLEILNELPPGGALVVPLALCWGLAVAIPVLATAWPSWRAAGRPPVALLRGAELRASAPARFSARLPAGLGALGARLVAARRARLAATLAVLGASAGFILLMLALASELTVLQSDPSALGKRYELTAALPASATARVRALPGVADAAPRYDVQALDSFSLGETIDVIAYPGDHTAFEAPPLAGGHRLVGRDEAEVGTGLAQVLGLGVGSVLAIQLPSGSEARFRVAGLVSSLQHDGRVAYIPATALLSGDPSATEQIAVRLQAHASSARVSRELTALGATAAPTGTATGHGKALVGALTGILRAVAVVDGLVCLYALAQALALTARERRATIAVLRACGAGPGAVRWLLAGAAAAVVLPAAVIGIVLERLVLGPAMSRLAAGYASLTLAASTGEIVIVTLGLGALAATAVLWVARQSSREPIVAGLGT